MTAHIPHVAPGPRLPFLGRRVFAAICSCGWRTQRHHADEAEIALAEHRARVRRTA